MMIDAGRAGFQDGCEKMPTDPTSTGISHSSGRLADGSGAHLPKKRQQDSRKRGN